MKEKNIPESAGAISQLPENKMGVMPIPKLLFTMAIPAICSMMMQAIYNVVDSLFVAHYSDDALAAVTLVFPIQMLMIAVGVGTGVGLNSLIARRLGEKRNDDANNATTHGFLLGIFNWMIFLIFTFAFSKLFYQTFSDDANAAYITDAITYSNIVTGFSLFMFIQMICEKSLQATGNMMVPMVTNMIGCVINIILDPIFIFGYFGVPAMGAAGAAIATVIGQCIGSICSIIAFFFLSDHPLKVTFRGFRLSGKTLKDIYTVALPGMIMQAIPSFVTVFLNMILISFSVTAVSVLGVYFRIQSFVFMPTFGLSQGSAPIMGFNYGAGDKKRLLQTLKLSLGTAVIIMIIGLIIFQIFPTQIMSLFNAEGDMMTMGRSAMRILSLCFVPAAFGITFSTLFQALGFGTYSLLMTLLRQFVIILPVAWALSKVFGVTGVWLSYPIAEIFSLIAALLLFARIYKRQIKPMPSHSNEPASLEG